jgi:outer membrane PBP1 activator LpoA protein
MQVRTVLGRRLRWWIGLSLTGALIAAGCSLLQAVPSGPASTLDQARRAVAQGRHADAAREYAELALASPAEHDDYELLAAEQWVLAGDVRAAQSAFATVSPEARTKLPVSRALVAAEIALAENDGARALRELDTIGVPTQPELAQNYWWLRGKSAFLTGHPVEGTRAFVERERYLADAGALHASRGELFALERTAFEHGQSLKIPPKTDPIVAGWLALAPVAVEMSRNPAHAAAALEAWKRAYPQHPASDVLAVPQSQMAAATEYPEQIALLLPLSGRSESVGIAVRDGFIAGWLEQDPASRPRLKIYDVAGETVAGAYQHALADGASFVVGPLTKEDVAAVAPLDAGKTPLLALNYLADELNAPKGFYQFALLPEDEARTVARRLIQENKLKGVAIVAGNEWGTRVGAAFSEELTQHGGTVLDFARYEGSRADFSDLIKQVLQVHGVKGEPSTHRPDVDFVFIAASTAGAARLIVPQLKFNFAGDVPPYSTADSFEPDPGANLDLDGLTFPDMPWMVSADPVTAQIRDAVRGAWPTRTARRDRLYAFGFDAFRLVPELKSHSLSESNRMNGVTGRLYLDERGRIHRDLDWAQIKNGVPVIL